MRAVLFSEARVPRGERLRGDYTLPGLHSIAGDSSPVLREDLALCVMGRSHSVVAVAEDLQAAVRKLSIPGNPPADFP